jgi:hypothetical protein
MTRVLKLETIRAALGTIAVLVFLPSMGRASDQRETDSAVQTPTVEDVWTPVLHAGAFQPEPTGPFRRAAVKAEFAKAVVPDESDGRCALKAPGLFSQPAAGIATERAEPAAVRYSLTLTITREADANSAGPSRPAGIGNAKSKAAPSAYVQDPVPLEPGILSIGKLAPPIPSTVVVPGPAPPVAAGSVAGAQPGRGSYPQCRYLGCSGPLACRECVYCGEIQHYNYYPAMHGYYYFAPYNAIKVPFQQAFGGRFGGDPRVPYANGVFRTVYAAYWATHPAPCGELPDTTRPEEVPPPEPTNPFQEAGIRFTPKRG